MPVHDDSLTCGWLLSETTRLYLQAQREQQAEGKKKFRRKLIIALKSVAKKEGLDHWLTQYERPLRPLQDGEHLEAHFCKVIPGKKKEVLFHDFELVKVVGKGGFSTVFEVRKKDTGFLYAMKVMTKNLVSNDRKLQQILSERQIMEGL